MCSRVLYIYIYLYIYPVVDVLCIIRTPVQNNKTEEPGGPLCCCFKIITAIHFSFFFIYLFSFLYLVVDKFLKQKRGTSENKNRILEMFFF